MTRALLLLVTLFATACGPGATSVDAGGDVGAVRDGGASVAYAALVPDPSRAGELAFGVHVAGAFFPSPGFEANGNMFLFVDHAGNWWAQQFSPLEVHTGTLDAATLAAINEELLTGPWSAVDGEHVTSCCDAPTTYLARDEIRASVYMSAPGASDRLAALLTTSMDWIGRLAPTGVPMTGPVRLELRLLPGGAGTDPTMAWPLATPLADLLGGADHVATVLEDPDATTLRADRQGIFVDGPTTASFVVSDVVPFADATGCLRPIGGMACR